MSVKKIDAEKQARLDALMDKDNEEGLMEEERAEFVLIMDEGHRLTIENAEELLELRASGVDIEKLPNPREDTLTPEEWTLVDERIEAHRRDPSTAIPVEKMKDDLRKRI